MWDFSVRAQESGEYQIIAVGFSYRDVGFYNTCCGYYANDSVGFLFHVRGFLYLFNKN